MAFIACDVTYKAMQYALTLPLETAKRRMQLQGAVQVDKPNVMHGVSLAYVICITMGAPCPIEEARTIDCYIPILLLSRIHALFSFPERHADVDKDHVASTPLFECG